MVIYHFAWDLWAFGLIATDVGYGPFWRLFAHTIASTFLAIVGISLALANRNGIRRDAFLRRLAMVAGGAVAVSIVTWIIEPQMFVFFGILHLIVVASVLAPPFLTLPPWATAVAVAAVIAVGNLFASPLFNSPWMVWLGIATEVPATVDYYPVFPWFGAVLAGIVAGKLFLESGLDRRLGRWHPGDPLTRFLEFAGRWSLVIYLLHQLVLFGGVSLVAPYLAVRQALPATANPGTAFMDDCLPACGAQGLDVATCTTYCGCMLAGLSGTEILAIPAEQLSDEQRGRLGARSRQCAAAAVPARAGQG